VYNILPNGSIQIPGRPKKFNAMIALIFALVVIVAVYCYNHPRQLWLVVVLIAVVSYLDSKVIKIKFAGSRKATTIMPSQDGLMVNDKFYEWEKVLFISMRERENYSMLRIELVRKSIMVPNEIIVLTNLEGYEHALAEARKLKQILGSQLRINDTRIHYKKKGGASSLDDWHEVV
jgi:hypothetical protein